MIQSNNSINEKLIDKIRGVIDPAENAFLVGGVIRDLLIGKSCHDVDLVLLENARGVSRKAADMLGGKFFALDEDRGMFRILLKNEQNEITVIDISRLQANSLEADLRLRDFTINAIAFNLHNPALVIDPMLGRQDLIDKVMRPCSDLSIQNDPVRAIRAVRISLAFDLRMEPHLINMIRDSAHLLAGVSSERKRDELLKIFDGPSPESALRMLDHLGVLREIIPDLEKLKGVKQSLPHTMDVWEHTLAVVHHQKKLFDLFLAPQSVFKNGRNLMLGLTAGKLGLFRQDIRDHFDIRLNPFRSRTSLNLLAGLLHDIDKPSTSAMESDGRIHFFEHEILGAEKGRKIGQSLALSELETDALATIITSHLKPHNRDGEMSLPDRRRVFRFFRSTGQFGVDTCFLSLADQLARTSYPPADDVWLKTLERTGVFLEGWFRQQSSWVRPSRIIDGNELMRVFKLPPGKIIGTVLDQIYESQAAGEISTHEEAIQMAGSIIRNIARYEDG
jgi:tRNA nucleotidyltransferase/poly(A) polymerase